jgi:hypothetical protein
LAAQKSGFAADGAANEDVAIQRHRRHDREEIGVSPRPIPGQVLVPEPPFTHHPDLLTNAHGGDVVRIARRPDPMQTKLPETEANKGLVGDSVGLPKRAGGQCRFS